MIKAIFIDIDGTLRDSNRNLSVRTIETIKKVSEKGILVILCSGRPRKYVENISRQCNASKYIIASNGGSVFDYLSNEIIYKNIIDKEIIFKLCKIAKESNTNVIIDSDENICTIYDEDFTKMRMLRKNIEEIEKVEIKQEIVSLGDDNISNKERLYYFIGNIELSKGYAIKKFCEKLNIRKEDTIAIGDDINDLSMFEQVGYKVAVSNAIDIVKEKADEITLSNDEDGVAVFLNKLLENY